MSNVFKIDGPLRVGSLSGDPANPQPGYIYFNTSTGTYRFYENSSFRDISAEELASLGALIGTLDGSPANYTPSEASVSGHLQGIDSALSGLSTDASTTTYTPAVLADWDSDSDPGNVDDALDQLAERVDDNEIAIAQNASDISDKIDSADLASNSNGLGASLVGIEDSADQFTATNVEAALAEALDAAQAAQSTADAAIPATEKGANNGVATLDGGGKIPASQLPNSVMELQGEWNANTNSPSLADGVGNPGDVYEVTVAGSQDLGSGSISFAVGDWVVYSASGVWYKSLNSNEVTSVNGQTGTVVLDADDIDDTSTTNKFATQAQLDAADSALQSGDNVSELTNDAGYITELSEDTTPALGGDLEVGANSIEAASNPVLLAGQNSVRRAKQASKSNFIEEEYIHAISLSGSQSDTVITAFTFAHASIEGLEIVYKLKEASTNNVKIGTIRVVTNGSSVVLVDVGTDTAETGITFSAAINGANVEVSYSSGTNGATMRADVKKFLA